MARFLAVLAAAAALVASNTGAFSLERRAITSCSSAARELSCHSSQSVDPSSSATCCYNGALKSGQKESGLIVATQFWDANPSTGPSNSATIHGLWPDYCDGTYPQYCSSDSGIAQTTGSHIQSVLKQYDPNTLNYMKTYYKDVNGDDPSFWEHEFNKHGTCYTTLRSKCFNPPSGLSAADDAILSYFQQIVKQFKALPTYKWLANAGITPSSSKTYYLSDIQDALSNAFGGDVYIGCDNNNNVDEFWYFYNVKGSLINGTYYATDSTASSSCSSRVTYRE